MFLSIWVSCKCHSVIFFSAFRARGFFLFFCFAFEYNHCPWMHVLTYFATWGFFSRSYLFSQHFFQLAFFFNGWQQWVMLLFWYFLRKNNLLRKYAWHEIYPVWIREATWILCSQSVAWILGLSSPSTSCTCSLQRFNCIRYLHVILPWYNPWFVEYEWDSLIYNLLLKMLTES